MGAGECYNITVTYNMTADAGLSTASSVVNCNGSALYCCSILGGNSAQGSFTPFTVKYGDCVHIRNGVAWSMFAASAEACTTINNLSNCVGYYCLVEPTGVYNCIN
jgi:hypothetical protein